MNNTQSDHEIARGNTFQCNKTNGNSMPAMGHLPEYCPYCGEKLKFFEWLEETDWIENKIDKADAILNGYKVEIASRLRGALMYDVRYLEGPKRGEIDMVKPKQLEELNS